MGKKRKKKESSGHCAMHKTFIRYISGRLARVDFTTYLDNEVPPRGAPRRALMYFSSKQPLVISMHISTSTLSFSFSLSLSSFFSLLHRLLCSPFSRSQRRSQRYASRACTHEDGATVAYKNRQPAELAGGERKKKRKK